MRAAFDRSASRAPNTNVILPFLARVTRSSMSFLPGGPRDLHMAGRSRTRGDRNWKLTGLAWGISDSVLNLRRLPPPVRFMGAHLFLFSTMIAELAPGALKSGAPRRLMDSIESTAAQPGETHPVPPAHRIRESMVGGKVSLTPT